MFREKIVPLFLHSLPYSPPSTQATWGTMNRISTYVSRLILNDWDWDKNGADLQSAANIPSLSYLAS